MASMAHEIDPTAFLPLHHHDFRIILALLSGPSYGTRIVREIEACEKGSAKLYPANLFRRIRDLLVRGLVEECDPPAGADSRRSYIGLTQLGHAVARLEALRLEGLVEEARAQRLLSESRG
jgi:hypothetical protein